MKTDKKEQFKISYKAQGLPAWHVENLKIGNMRGKPQEFIIYPFKENCESWTLQSDKRIMRISRNGNVLLSKQCQSGAYFVHLNRALGAIEFDCPADLLEALKGLGPQGGTTRTNFGTRAGQYGYSNEQTAMFILMLDNEREYLGRALACYSENDFKRLAANLAIKCCKFSSWCFKDVSDIDKINYLEVLTHYNEKRSEKVTV